MKLIKDTLKHRNYNLRDKSEFKKYKKLYWNYKTYQDRGNNKLKCDLCEKLYDRHYIDEHLRSKKHLKKLENIQ